MCKHTGSRITTPDLKAWQVELGQIISTLNLNFFSWNVVAFFFFFFFREIESGKLQREKGRERISSGLSIECGAQQMRGQNQELDS